MSLNLGKLFGGVGVKRVAQTEENWICTFAITAADVAFKRYFGKITRFAGGVTAIDTASIPYSMPNNEAASIVDIYSPSGSSQTSPVDVVFDLTVNDIPQKIAFSAIAGNVANGAGRAKILKPVNIPASFPFQPTAFVTAVATTTATQTFVLRALLTPTK
jgi:hypothetical protein